MLDAYCKDEGGTRSVTGRWLNRSRNELLALDMMERKRPFSSYELLAPLS